MGDASELTNAGEQIGAPPANVALSREAEFRTLSKRIDDLTAEIGKISKPAQFRLADGIELATIVVALVVAWFTAMGLNDRINDVQMHQSDAERRIESHMDALENRLGQKIDKLSDQFTRMDERTSTLEGKLSSKPVSQPK